MNLKFWKPFKLTDHMSLIDRLVIFLAEFIGTAILMFVGCMGCAHHNRDVPRFMVEAGLTFGIAVLMAIQCFGHISGAHINPIITIGAVIAGVISLVNVPIYLVAQILGSLAGYGFLRLLLSETNIYGNFTPDEGICAVGLAPKVTLCQGLFLEVLISFVLVTVARAVWDIKNVNAQDSVPIRFGLAVGVLVIAVGPFTGAHMNPARTLGPSVLNGYFENHWIFWVGPIFGGALASVLYTILYTAEEVKEE